MPKKSVAQRERIAFRSQQKKTESTIYENKTSNISFFGKKSVLIPKPSIVRKKKAEDNQEKKQILLKLLTLMTQIREAKAQDDPPLYFFYFSSNDGKDHYGWHSCYQPTRFFSECNVTIPNYAFNIGESMGSPCRSESNYCYDDLYGELYTADQTTLSPTPTSDCIFNSIKQACEEQRLKAKNVGIWLGVGLGIGLLCVLIIWLIQRRYHSSSQVNEEPPVHHPLPNPIPEAQPYDFEAMDHQEQTLEDDRQPTMELTLI